MKLKSVLFILTILIINKVFAFDMDGIYYSVLSSSGIPSVAVTYGQVDYSGDIVIPAEVTYGGVTYKVISIGDFAFDGCSNLNSIHLPSTITSIGYKAFRYCDNLKEINLEDTKLEEIGENAFFSCESLESISLPATLETIGEDAFIFCVFSSINVDSQNTTFDSREKCNAIIETASNTLLLGCKNTFIPNYWCPLKLFGLL